MVLRSMATLNTERLMVICSRLGWPHVGLYEPAYQCRNVHPLLIILKTTLPYLVTIGDRYSDTISEGWYGPLKVQFPHGGGKYPREWEVIVVTARGKNIAHRGTTKLMLKQSSH